MKLVLPKIIEVQLNPFSNFAKFEIVVRVSNKQIYRSWQWIQQKLE
jgi:hypothetical protein